MDTPLDDGLFHRFSELLERRMGLHFAPSRRADLLRGLRAAAPALGFDDVASCMRALLATWPDRRVVEILAAHLAVGETYFFRDPALFAALEREVLPALIHARAAERRLRIWSAGCCTGEEPYSLAILLAQLLGGFETWHVTILGTDLNAEFVAKAEKAVYREWSFRAMPPPLRQRYFRATPAGERLDERCRRVVHFATLNLVDDVYPSLANNTNAMDIVLCRNVMMYFAAPTARAVAERLGRAVVDGGWLVAAPAEIDAARLAGFEPVQHGGAILVRKRPARRTAVEAPRRSATTVVPVATAPSTPAARAPASRDRSRYDDALAACGRGDYAAANTLLAGLNDVSALALSARCHANLGALDEARMQCEAAIALDKDDAGLRYLLAAILDESGCCADALVALRQAIFLDPDHVLAQFASASLYRRLGDAKRAAAHAATTRRLLAARPADAALPGSDGLTAGRLAEMLDAMQGAA